MHWAHIKEHRRTARP